MQHITDLCVPSTLEEPCPRLGRFPVLPVEVFTPAYNAAQAEKRGESAEARATPADAFRAAREIYLRGERIDMQALARELGVSRGTLYRWTGDRERLLADVLWSFAEELFDWTEATTKGEGAELLARRTDAYMHAVAGAPALRFLLKSDPELALRIITRPGQGVQERAVARFATAIEAEQARSGYDPPLEPQALSDAVVRIVASYVYTDLVAGFEPDLGRAGQVIRAVLGERGDS